MFATPRRARLVRLGWLWGLALLGLASATEAAERRAISEHDLFRFAWVVSPQVAGDGSRALFVRVGVDREKDDYDSSVWVVSTSGGDPRRLTAGPRDTSPRWSPDGSRLLFVRRVEVEGKIRPPQVFLLAMNGGEPRTLTDLPEGVSAPVWSPDGKTIAFLSGTTPDDLAKAANKAKGMIAPRESDVRVVTRTEFRTDNSGYRDSKHPSQVWTVAVPPSDSDDRPAAPRRLTSGPFDASDPTWSADGKRIFFVSTRDPDPAHRVDRSMLLAVAAEGGSVEVIATIAGSISAPSPRLDGKMIAFRGLLGDPPRSYTPPDLFVVDLTFGSKSTPRNLTADFDYDIGGGLSGDQHAPRGIAPTRPAWINGGTTLVDKVARQGRANLEAFDLATGKNSPITSGDRDLSAFSPSNDGTKLVILSQTRSHVARPVPGRTRDDLQPEAVDRPQR